MTKGSRLESGEASSMQLAAGKIAEESRAWAAIARQPKSQVDCQRMARMTFPELLYYALVFDGSS